MFGELTVRSQVVVRLVRKPGRPGKRCRAGIGNTLDRDDRQTAVRAVIVSGRVYGFVRSAEIGENGQPAGPEPAITDELADVGGRGGLGDQDE